MGPIMTAWTFPQHLCSSESLVILIFSREPGWENFIEMGWCGDTLGHPGERWAWESRIEKVGKNQNQRPFFKKMGPCSFFRFRKYRWTKGKIKSLFKPHRNCLWAPRGAFPLKSGEKTELDFSHTVFRREIKNISLIGQFSISNTYMGISEAEKVEWKKIQTVCPKWKKVTSWDRAAL